MNLSYLSRKLDEAIAGKKATRRVGASTGRHTCQHCGKKNLKKTVAVEDAKGRVRYYGATCYKNMSNDAAWFDFFKKKKEEPKKKEEQPQRTPDPYIIEMNRKSEPPEEKEKTYDPVILSPEDQKIAEAKSLEEFQKDIKWHYIFETLRKDYIHIPDFKGSKQFPSMRDVKLVIGTNEYNDFVEGAHIRQGLFLLKDGRYMSVEYQDNYEHDEEYAYYSLGNNFTNTVYAENNKRLEKNLKQQVANYEYAHPEHWDEPQPSSAPDTEKERKPISSKGEIPEVDVLEDLRNQKRAELKEFFEDYNWRTIFEDKGDVNAQYTPVPGYKGTTMRPEIENVKLIIAKKDGERDRKPWRGVFLMHDGKYLSVEAGHGYTGWDVGGYVDYSYANSFNEIVKLGLTKDAREDLKDQLLEYALNEKGKDLARNRKKPKKKTARKSSKK